MKKIINFLVLSVFLFFLIDFFYENKIYLEIFNKIKFHYILAFILLNLINYFLKTFINIYIFESINIKLSFSEAFNLSFKNTVGNLLGPLKAGSGYKLHYMFKNYDVSPTMYISTNTAYAVVSIFINFLILFLLTVFELNIIELSIFQIFLILISLSSIIVLTINFLTKNIEKIKLNFLKNFTIGFLSLFTNKILFFKLILLSLIFTILNISILYFVFSMYGFEITFVSTVLYSTLGSFTSLVKITPGNIGFYELIMISMSSFHGIQIGQILNSSIFIRTISYLTIILIFIYNFLKNLINSRKEQI